MKTFSKEKKTKMTSVRLKPSTLKTIKDKKINLSKLIEREVKLKSSKLIEVKK